MATVSSISFFTSTLDDHTLEGGSQTTATSLTIDGAAFDRRVTLAGGSGVAGPAQTIWSTSIGPSDFDYLWLLAEDSDTIQVELALGSTDVIPIILKQDIAFQLGRDDVLLRSAYNATPFNSPGSADVITRIAARNSATSTSTTGTLRVALMT